VPLYYARERKVVLPKRLHRADLFKDQLLPGEKTEFVKCRMRSLGCMPWHRCDPLRGGYRSEDYRGDDFLPPLGTENRAIDHDEEGSMEIKKREGYF